MTIAIELPISDVLSLYAEGKTAAQIGKYFGCSKRPVLRILKRNGARLRKAGTIPAIDWEVQKEEIVKRYLAGETQAQLAEAVGCMQTVVGDHLRAWSAETRRTGPQRHLPLDEDFFAIIDSELKAYWLGFLLADGGTNDSNNLIHRLELAVKDASHVMKFMAAVGRPSLPVFDYDKGSVRVDICCAKSCRDLAALECYPRKSCVHGTPYIAEKLQRHFYRGYVDGDGGLREHGRSWCFDATGSPVFISEFQQWLMQHANVAETKLIRRGLTLSVQYQGSKQVRRIAELLYANVTIYLDRKYAAFCRLLTWLPPGKRRKLTA